MVSGEYESADEPTRRERRELYDKVIGIVEHNTGDGAPVLCRPGQVKLIASHAGHDPDETQKKIDAAVNNNDDLTRFRGRLTRTDAESIQAVYDAEGDRENPDPDVLGECYRRLSGGDA